MTKPLNPTSIEVNKELLCIYDGLSTDPTVTSWVGMKCRVDCVDDDQIRLTIRSSGLWDECNFTMDQIKGTADCGDGNVSYRMCFVDADTITSEDTFLYNLSGDFEHILTTEDFKHVRGT